jgi:hypothetical protein
VTQRLDQVQTGVFGAPMVSLLIGPHLSAAQKMPGLRATETKSHHSPRLDRLAR